MTAAAQLNWVLMLTGLALLWIRTVRWAGRPDPLVAGGLVGFALVSAAMYQAGVLRPL
jgi:hypothetical protein